MHSVTGWVSELFIKAIRSSLDEKNQNDALSWLVLAREITNNNDLGMLEKIRRIYSIMRLKGAVSSVFNGVSNAVKNYKDSDLPLPVKIALPITLASAGLVGGQAAGVAAFGGAVGVPVLLVVFLGSAGITSILQAFWGDTASKSYVGAIMALVLHDEVLRRARKELRDAMCAEPVEPQRQELSTDAEFLVYQLRNMDPYDFERHVMSFFQTKGLIAWVTKKSNDMGVDGFARHPDGLIVVQCKRNGEKHPVMRPTVQQFKGVIEENGAWRGFLVTTASFSAGAKESAAQNERLVLIDVNELLKWHGDSNSLEIK